MERNARQSSANRNQVFFHGVERGQHATLTDPAEASPGSAAAMAGHGIPRGFDASWHIMHPAGIHVNRSELVEILVSRQHGIGRPYRAAKTGQAALTLLILPCKRVAAEKGVVDVVDKAFCVPPQDG